MDKMLTWEEFMALARYENGRIKDLYDIFLHLTPDQIQHLHDDDWSYYHGLMEELDYEISLLG